MWPLNNPFLELLLGGGRPHNEFRCELAPEVVPLPLESSAEGDSGTGSMGVEGQVMSIGWSELLDVALEDSPIGESPELRFNGVNPLWNPFLGDGVAHNRSRSAASVSVNGWAWIGVQTGVAGKDDLNMVPAGNPG